MKWDWNTFFIKLTSRKLWLAVAGFVGGIMAAVGYGESQIVQITGLIMSGASVLAYIISEGLVDAARESGDILLVENKDA
jgi:hypothetical protein